MNPRRSPIWVLVCLLLIAAPAAWAQNPTGTLTGRVDDSEGGSLPGVAVTATSPSLQGSRTAVTDTNGNYKMAFLPVGDYRVTYQLDGFSTVVREVKLSAAQTTPSNVVMKLGEINEEIVVTGQQALISETQTVAQTVTFDEVENLPIPRELDDIVNLTPGVTNSGFRSTTPVMGGAPSFENLYLVNGVVINENVRASILDLFIEDAIAETTTSLSSISAEYGRFTGGVVNAVTKSGGNEFSGSFRINLENEDWEARTPLSGERVDDISEVYEATLGGFLMKDHLWFFGAGRDFTSTESRQTDITNTQYPFGQEETRYEAKLTISPNDSHTIIGSYLEIDRTTQNSDFGTILDLRSLNENRADPQEIKSANYTGILSESFFAEAQYSERDFTLGIGSGGPQDLIDGTLIRTRNEGFRFFAPTFCGECEDELRNNENALVKGSYFLTTENFGTHDIVFGYDTFEDIRFVINHQTGSDFTVYGSDVVRNGAGDPIIDPATGTAIPIFDPDAASAPWIRWFAVFNEDLAQPTAFKTNSFYVNDSWQLNDRWSFNVGLRYDENDGTDSSGAQVADDTKVSPRLGLSWDVKGDGDMVVRASYGSYVSGLNQLADDASPGGAIGDLRFTYAGPPINVGCVVGVNCLSAEEVLRQVFDWYASQGGAFDLANVNPNAPITQFQNRNNVPGATLQIRDGISSPSVDELTLGITKRLGNKGLFRVDVVRREWEDFYGELTNLGTGQIDTSTGPADVTILGNFNNGIEREYTGLLTQFRYRFTDKLDISVNYTLSELEGNFNGETSNGGASSATTESYTQYREERWNYPTGNLLADQRHTLRAWANYNLLDTERHRLTFTWLENFFSGNPYSATFNIDPRPFVDNPGFADPPSALTYFPLGRGTFKSDDVHRTDISLNYSFNFNVGGRSVEVFLQPEVVNIFNEDAVIDPNNSTRLLQRFNPFTETPVEGVNWERRSTFGEPQNEADFQTPRTFRMSVGIRF
ncbi:MAG: TonB-dependent receptor [Acidobacteriota bacterium]